jgi:hypothetical protein
MLVVAMATVLLALAGAGASQAQPSSDLSGVWQGVYWEGGNARTPFQATVQDEPGPAISGSIVETNTISAANVALLLATFQGQVNGDRISFVKTYDGSGGESHQVMYTGRVLSSRHVVGTWSIGATSGQFEMGR